MGLFDFIRGQFVDIIEWMDDTNDTLVWRFPRHNNEIKNGAQLIVREGQVAIFVFEGKMADIFTPGLYTLTTQNIPIMSSFEGWKYGFESPFKCEVYFVNTRQYVDMKWGTLNPIMMRDQDFGTVRLRAFGIYSIRVNADNAPVFFRELVGTDGEFTKDEIEGQLKRELVSAFTTVVAKSNIPALELAANYQILAETCHAQMQEPFGALGITLTRFIIENISLPPEVEQAMDQRASMGAVGNLGQYTQYQAAQSMRDAAQQPGGMAGMSMGVGAGMAMGQVMTGAMANAQNAAAAPAAGGDSIADRLKQLKDLQAQGLIDESAFAAKRDEILAEI
jgi:membrane protease subunit (stomatin/prohibitin family)